jgi:hypothetical protein
LTKDDAADMSHLAYLLRRNVTTYKDLKDAEEKMPEEFRDKAQHMINELTKHAKYVIMCENYRSLRELNVIGCDQKLFEKDVNTLQRLHTEWNKDYYEKADETTKRFVTEIDTLIQVCLKKIQSNPSKIQSNPSTPVKSKFQVSDCFESNADEQLKELFKILVRVYNEDGSKAHDTDGNELWRPKQKTTLQKVAKLLKAVHDALQDRSTFPETICNCIILWEESMRWTKATYTDNARNFAKKLLEKMARWIKTPPKEVEASTLLWKVAEKAGIIEPTSEEPRPKRARLYSSNNPFEALQFNTETVVASGSIGNQGIANTFAEVETESKKRKREEAEAAEAKAKAEAAKAKAEAEAAAAKAKAATEAKAKAEINFNEMNIRESIDSRSKKQKLEDSPETEVEDCRSLKVTKVDELSSDMKLWDPKNKVPKNTDDVTVTSYDDENGSQVSLKTPNSDEESDFDETFKKFFE